MNSGPFTDPSTGLPFSWGSTSPLATPNGLLLVGKADPPGGAHDFRLDGREAGQDLFRLGASTEDNAYYLWFNAGDRSRIYWGRLDLAGAPGAEIPLDATDLPAVLGIVPLPKSQTQIPAVAMRMSHEPGAEMPCEQKPAYILTYIDRQPVTGRVLFKREYYFPWTAGGEVPTRPFRVKLLDARGLTVMTAELGEYRSIAPEDLDAEPSAALTMPTDIRIAWAKAKIHIVLSEMTTADKVDPAAYLFWDRLPGALEADRAVQVDRNLAPKGPRR